MYLRQQRKRKLKGSTAHQANLFQEYIVVAAHFALTTRSATEMIFMYGVRLTLSAVRTHMEYVEGKSAEIARESNM